MPRPSTRRALTTRVALRLGALPCDLWDAAAG